jgi:hypothetical protein
MLICMDCMRKRDFTNSDVPKFHKISELTVGYKISRGLSLAGAPEPGARGFDFI